MPKIEDILKKFAASGIQEIDRNSPLLGATTESLDEVRLNAILAKVDQLTETERASARQSLNTLLPNLLDAIIKIASGGRL